MSEKQLEVWKDIPGFEDKYQVSTMGRVRSLPRLTSITNFKGNTFIAEKKRNFINPTKRWMWICPC